MADRQAIRDHLVSGDIKKARLEMRAALGDGSLTREQVAEDVVAFADERILAGDLLKSDEAVWGAVHEGVPVHVMFNAVKALARRPKR